MKTQFVHSLKAIQCFSLLFAIVAAGESLHAGPPSGRVIWWGSDYFGKEGYSDHTNGVIESEDGIVSNATTIAAGRWQGLLLRADAKVLGFGNNISGGNEVPAGLADVISISVGGNSCWAIKRDGTVVRWGGGPDDANIVASLSNVVSITWAGYRKYLALKNDGTVLGFCLDDPQAPVKQVKVSGQMLSNVVALASQNHTPLILRNDGKVFCLGYQTPGAPPVEPQYEARGNVLYEFLGAESAFLPYQYTSADPVLIDGRALSNVVALAGESGHALALKKDGTVAAWGDNHYGETIVPAGLSNVVAIAADEHQSLALKADGTVVAWGGNYYGQTSVPAGLSNVVAIASGWGFNLALTTGSIPSSVFITPHGILEKMAREADLVFKGRVVFSRPITNAAFPPWGNPHLTELNVISVLKGKVDASQVDFLHNTHGPNAWGGGSPPPDFILNPGAAYIIYAAKAHKPDWLYTAPSNYVAKPNEFRQLVHGLKPVRTLDARPLNQLSVKEAHWVELNRLLQDTNLSNELYAVELLDQLSLAGRGDDRWRHSDDFKRKNVLRVLLPLVTNRNEQVACRTLNCFVVDANTTEIMEPFAETLIQVANEAPSPGRRLAAIAGLSGTHFQSVSNSLAALLKNPQARIRSGAVGLLALYPGEFTRQSLRACAGDPSPRVRAAVADAIGNGKMADLLPVVVKLLSDPVGRSRPVGMTIEQLQEGGRVAGVNDGITIVDDPGFPGANVGDVHTSAGYALLKFDVDQVSNILTANLDDAGFRPNYLCKLAEKNAGPWLTNLVEVLEVRRERIRKEVEASNVEPKVSYFQARMTLSGTYFRIWRILCAYLHDLPSAEFADGRLDRFLDALENAGSTGSQEPTELYELYRQKGLEKRAADFRRKCEKTFAYDLSIYFNRIDLQFTNLPAVPAP